MREREKEREEKRKKILRAIHSNSSAGVLDVKTAYNGQPATALFNVSVAQSGGASSGIAAAIVMSWGISASPWSSPRRERLPTAAERSAIGARVRWRKCSRFKAASCCNLCGKLLSPGMAFARELWHCAQ